MKIVAVVAKYADVEIDAPDEFFELDDGMAIIKDDNFTDVLQLCMDEAASSQNVDEMEVMSIHPLDENYWNDPIWEC